jgi:MoaA/NifB/PqqE/SkfB family radical SAM enzyme
MSGGARADVKVGFACNNRCVFCAQGEKRDACGTVPVDTIAERLVEVRKRTRGLVLTGGEPTLHKSILRVVHMAARLGFDPIQIQTNGRLLRYPETVTALLHAGATEFSPSLHGSTAEIHDGLTRARGSFDDSVAGIRAIVSRGLVVVTNSVVTRANVGDVPALVRLLGSLGVKNAQLAFVHPVGTAELMFDEVVPRLGDVEPAVRAARDVAREAGMRLVTEGIPYCFLRGMEELAVEDSIPETTVVDLDGAALDYSRWREAEGKAHGPPCEGCSRRARCEGPWREVPAKWGWDEYVPFGPGE